MVKKNDKKRNVLLNVVQIALEMLCFVFLGFFVFWFLVFKRALTRATDPAAPPTGRWEWKKSAVQLLECKTSRRTNRTACSSDRQISSTKLVTSHKRHYCRAAHFASIPNLATWPSSSEITTWFCPDQCKSDLAFASVFQLLHSNVFYFIFL